MDEAIPRGKWRWHLVVDAKGNVMEAFNSFEGAEQWADRTGGIVIKVKEIADGTNS